MIYGKDSEYQNTSQFATYFLTFATYSNLGHLLIWGIFWDLYEIYALAISPESQFATYWEFATCLEFCHIFGAMSHICHIFGDLFPESLNLWYACISWNTKLWGPLLESSVVPLQGTFLDPFGDPFWGPFGYHSGSLCDSFGMPFGSFLGTFWGHLVVSCLGPFRDPLWVHPLPSVPAPSIGVMGSDLQTDGDRGMWCRWLAIHPPVLQHVAPQKQ